MIRSRMGQRSSFFGIDFNLSKPSCPVGFGFFSYLPLIVWLPFFAMGTFAVTIYSAHFGFGWLGFGIFVGADVAIAVFWNEARKHSRANAFDDLLSSDKIERAREWWMNKRESGEVLSQTPD